MINLNSINNYTNFVFPQKQNRSPLISFKASNPPGDVFTPSESNKIKTRTNLILNEFAIKHLPTKQHMVACSLYAKALAKEAGLSQKEINDIELGTLLHDAGKLQMPDSFFTNPSDVKFQPSYKKHPINGYLALKTFLPEKAAQIALYHHEKFDGTGFPYKLKGEKIPLEARIASVADVFDSMTRKKYPGQKAKSPEQAVKELGKCHLDPKLVEKFIKIVSQDDFYL